MGPYSKVLIFFNTFNLTIYSFESVSCNFQIVIHHLWSYAFLGELRLYGSSLPGGVQWLGFPLPLPQEE